MNIILKYLDGIKGNKTKENLCVSIHTSQIDLMNNYILDIGCGFGDLNSYLNHSVYEKN